MITQERLAGYAGKKIFVTGGNGYIGSSLVQQLLSLKAEVTVITRKEATVSKSIKTIQADITKPRIWYEIVSVADIIFHLAGNTSVYTAAADPLGSFESTTLPVVHLLAAAVKQKRAPRVVYASTVTLYGFPLDQPVSEDTPADAVTLYDLHKCFSEQQLAYASREKIIEGVSLRLANVYGPSVSVSSSDDRGIINRITRQALQGMPLSLYGGGHYTRDYVYIDDVVNLFLLAGIVPGATGEFNVVSGKGRTVREAFHTVAAKAEKMTGRKVSVGDVEWPASANRIEYRNFIGNPEKSASVLGWHAAVEFDEGIDRMIAVFQQQ